MPQLDFIIASSQIFWLILIFFVLYTTLTHFFLPNFIKILKTRKKVLLENGNKLENLKKCFRKKHSLFDNIIDLNLTKIKILVEKEITLLFKSFDLMSLNLLNKDIARVFYFNLISYDINVLKSVSMKPVF